MCLVIFKENVMAVNNHSNGVSYITLTENDMCSDIFNHDQCMYMQRVIKVVVDEFKQDKINLEQEKQQDKMKFEEEKTILVDQIIQIKHEVKLLKKLFKKTQRLNNDKLRNNNKNSQSMQIHKLLTDVDPLFSKYYDDYQWANDIDLGKDGMANITRVSIYFCRNITVL